MAEIAGLILGGFPLLISALEQQRKVRQVLNDWWQYNQQFKKFQQALAQEQVLFIETLEALLIPVVDDEYELQQLLENPYDAAWREPKVEARLRDRLPKSYTIFVGIIEEMNEVMENLKPMLEADILEAQEALTIYTPGQNTLQPKASEQNTLQPKASEQNTLQLKTSKSWLGRLPRRLGIRVRLSGKASKKQLTNPVDSQILRCSNTFKVSDTVGQQSLSSASTLVASETIHSQQSLSSSSKFKVVEKVNDQIQGIKFGLGRPKREDMMAELSKHNSSLHKLLDSSDKLAILRKVRHARSIGATLQAFWKHANVLFDLLADLWCHDCKGLHRAYILLQHNINHIKTHKVEFGVSILLARAEACPFSRDRIWKFQEMDIRLLKDAIAPRKTTIQIAARDPSSKPRSALAIHEAPAQGSRSPSPYREPPASLQEPNAPEITNLCTNFEISTPHLEHSRSIGFLRSKESRYLIRRLGLRQECPETTSLESLLPDLTRKQRLLLAFIIASSHLQLHSSPWLSTPWSIKDIHFLHREALDKPYLFCQLAPNSEVIIDSDVSSLGIVLLELCFGKTLEHYRAKEGIPTPTNRFSIVASAMEWCDESVESEAGEKYAEAIIWCLQSYSRRRRAVGDEWKKELLEKVIEEMKNCYQFIAGEKV